ncbi:uncharacterized protein N7482_000335 [Penicillium canariense]|uniref:ZZ-type domain-containing protein n=1 Tax=Penicillium canariense TaxID=189055 RepID=A0A9W9IB89_9EURO|nr:uncharacterized protein N7482_000335 [Penicillium canariense]KAJ5174458.1 hypothetical protein N7482_000335 [Penicillium canariense]
MPLIPRFHAVVPPEAVFIHEEASVVRVGAMLFRKVTDAGQGTIYEELCDKVLEDGWEDIICRGDFLVLCRRRKSTAAHKPLTEEKKRQRVQAMRQRMKTVHARQDRLLSKSSSRDSRQIMSSMRRQIARDILGGHASDLEVDTDSSETGSDSSSSNGLPDFPSAEESWSEEFESEHDLLENISEGDSAESDLDLESCPSSSTDSDIESRISNNSGGSSELGDTESLESHVNLSSCFESEGTESSFESDEDSITEFTPVSPSFENKNSVKINDHGVPNICCDMCVNISLRIWYHCVHCEDDSFDLCQRCEREGRWCFDLDHQLYRYVARKPVGVISRRSFTIRQEIAILRLDQKTPKLLFHLHKKYRDVIYGSPPVIHACHPLVVWPLSGSRLLFADFENNKFFEYKIASYTRRKCEPFPSVLLSPSERIRILG